MNESKDPGPFPIRYAGLLGLESYDWQSLASRIVYRIYYGQHLRLEPHFFPLSFPSPRHENQPENRAGKKGEQDMVVL